VTRPPAASRSPRSAPALPTSAPVWTFNAARTASTHFATTRATAQSAPAAASNVRTRSGLSPRCTHGGPDFVATLYLRRERIRGHVVLTAGLISWPQCGYNFRSQRRGSGRESSLIGLAGTRRLTIRDSSARSGREVSTKSGEIVDLDADWSQKIVRLCASLPERRRSDLGTGRASARGIPFGHSRARERARTRVGSCFESGSEARGE
jgi:hypothetical protein